ncbi:branched-chain amino acid ABC transporter permease [bacterium]|nr:MAG: branched-chain amino acid ABC transporter permease [bacterium]
MGRRRRRGSKPRGATAPRHDMTYPLLNAGRAPRPLGHARASEWITAPRAYRLPGLIVRAGVQNRAMVSALPAPLVGVANTHNLYWIALAYLAIICAVGWWAVNSPPGRVWQAIRESELRVEVLGLNPYLYKLLAFVLSSFLASAAGVVYLLSQGGTNPEVTTANFTLAFLVMVVPGGVGTLWGAVIGGVVYQYLDFRLVALSNTPALAGLPDVLRVPLSEPLFILGALFVALVLFFPGGSAGSFSAGEPPSTKDLPSAAYVQRRSYRTHDWTSGRCRPPARTHRTTRVPHGTTTDTCRRQRLMLG